MRPDKIGGFLLAVAVLGKQVQQEGEAFFECRNYAQGSIDITVGGLGAGRTRGQAGRNQIADECGAPRIELATEFKVAGVRNPGRVGSSVRFG